MWRILTRQTVLVMAVLVVAALLPATSAQAKVGGSAGLGHSSVDTFAEWTVSGSAATQTVQLTRFVPASDPVLSGWTYQAEVTSTAAGFGHSVGVGPGSDRDDPLIVVGAPEDDAVFLYRFDGFGMNLVTTIVAPAAGSAFGASVDTSRGRVLIGAPEANGGQGTSYLYDSNGVLIREIIDASVNATANFGRVVQLEGERAFVSAPLDADGLGTVFEFAASTGGVNAVITANNPTAGMNFGALLSADPGRVLIGGSGLTTAFLQQGANQTEIPHPMGSTIADVALEGNLIAFDSADALEAVHVLSDNGTTGSFGPVTISTSLNDVREIVLAGGWLMTAATAGSFPADPNRVLEAQYISDTSQTQKIVPYLGLEEGNYGNRVDISGTTLIAARGKSTLLGQVVVSEQVPTSWSPSGWTPTQLIDLSGPAAGGVAIEGDVFVASVGDGGDASNPHLVVYTRSDATAPFTLAASFRTDFGAPPRAVAIDETGQLLAVGLPGPGRVEVWSGGPASWGAGAPQVLLANDSAGNGPQTFGHDLDFGEGFLVIGKPETSSLAAGSALAGAAEQWRVDQATGQVTYFSDFVNAVLTPGDAFGWTVEIEQDIRAIGEPGTGTVLVKRSGLGDATLTDPSPAGGAFWSSSMAIDSGVLVVGDWAGDIVAYDAYGAGVTEIGSFQASDAEAADATFSTFPLATSNGVVMAGARLEDWQGRDAGAIYTFTVPTSEPPTLPRSWLPVVDMDNGLAVVGNPVQDLVHVVQHDGSGWIEIQQISGEAATSFGAAVAIEGDHIYVGSPEANDGVGTVSRYVRDASGQFAPVSEVTYSGATADDLFGSVLDVSNGWVIAGAPVPGTTGSAVIWDLSLATEVGVLTTPALDDEFGTAVAISQRAPRAYQGDGTTPGEPYAWVGAPLGRNGSGLVSGQQFAYRFDGTNWVEIGITSANEGDLRGSALAATNNWVLTSNPGRGVNGNFRQTAWRSDGLVDGLNTWSISSPADGDIDLNGNVYVIGAPSANEVHVLSNNAGETPTLLGVHTGAATGRSVATDGDWFVGATDAVSTDWQQLAEIVQVSSFGPQPGTPDNKIAAPFGTNFNRFGYLVDSTDDTWVAVSPSWQIGMAPNSIHVYDSASSALIQRITDPVVGSFITDIALDGDRMAVITEDGVSVLQRSGPGQPYDQELGPLAVVDGRSVDLNGDLLAVGRSLTDEVLPFQFDGATWVPLPVLSSAVAPANAAVGRDVAVFADVVVASAPGTGTANSPGSLVVWSRTDNAAPFVEQPALIAAPDTIERDRLGLSLDFDGTWLVAGAPQEGLPAINNTTNPGNPGGVHVYRHLGAGLFAAGQLIDPASEIPGDHSNSAWGHSVAVRDGVIAVGAPGYAPDIGNRGYYAGGTAAYFYDLATSSWRLADYVEANRYAEDPARWDYLGMDVALTTIGAQPAVVAGAPNLDTSGTDAGAVYTFQVIVAPTPPEPDNKLVSEPGSDLSDAEVGDLFGYATDTDGTRLVVGVPEFASLPLPLGDLGSGGAGGVYVFSRGVDGWDYEQFVPNPDVGGANSRFGAAVAVEGDMLVVGAPAANSSTGTAWIIDLSLVSPAPPIEIVPAAAIGSAQYGSAIDIEGALIAVGAPGLDFDPDGNPVPASNYGAFYLWESDGATWQVVLADGGDTSGDQFGRSITLDAGNLAVGTLGNQAGYVDIWRRDGAGGFVADQRVVGPDSVQFGFAIDLDGSRLVVGAPNAESATLYTFENGTWDSGYSLVPTAADNGDDFGFSVAINGTVIAVGEPADEGVDENSGRIHVFGNTSSGEWTVIDELVTSDGAAQDWFGFAVEVADGEVIATAPFDDNTNGLEAGGAYTFAVAAPPEPPADNKLIAPVGSDPTDGEAGDFFGSAIDSDGSRLVIGAPENTATGQTGGVYVYSSGADGWEFETYIENPVPTDSDSSFGLSVAVEGDLLVVGSPFSDTNAGSNAGTVWLIDLLTGAQTTLPAPAGRANHFYGITLDLDGDLLAVGARGDADDGAGGVLSMAGELHIFEGDGAGSWTPVLTRPGQSAGDQYTAGLAVDGDRVAAGAVGGIGAGYVEVLVQSAPGVWMVQQVLDGLSAGDQFGFGLDLDGNNLAVAAPGVPNVTMFTYEDNSWDAGVDFSGLGEIENLGQVSIDGTIVIVGDPFFDEAVNNEGRAIVYGNTAWKEWTPIATFANPDGERGDFFGETVFAHGGNVFIGARSDNNRNGLDAGAVYLGSVTPPPPPVRPVDPTVITEISYVLPSSVMPGATSVTIEGAALATTSEGATSGGGIVAASVGSIDLDSPPTGSAATDNPLGGITLGELGIDAEGIGNTALSQVLLSEFPVDGGWAQYLIGTPFEGVPLQAVTLGDVWDFATVQSIELRATDIEASPIRFTDLAVIAFGEISLLDIEIDDPAAATNYEAWCTVFEQQGTSCSELGIASDSTVTLGDIAAAGVNIEATPIRFTPIRFTYLQSTALSATPIRFTDVQASPIRFTPIRFTPIRFTPIRFTPIRFTPIRFTDIHQTALADIPIRFTNNQAAVADCSTALVDCETATLGDAFDAGVLRDDLTFDDIGQENLGDLRVEDLLAGLTQETIDALFAVFDDETITLESLVLELGEDALGELTLGDIDPEAFDAIAELASYTIGDFLESLPEDVLAGFTIDDFLLLFIPREAYAWDDVDLGSVNLQLAGMQAPVTASIAFSTADGPVVDDITLVIDLPAGGVAQPSSFRLGSSAASVRSVDVTATTATVEIANVARGSQQTLTFGLYQGLDLGSSDSNVLALAAQGGTASASDSITVVEAFEPENDGLIGAVPVLADNLYVSHIGTSGDADFFRLTVTEPATTVSVQLANLSADLDLVVYGPRLGSILPPDGSQAASAPAADFDASGSGSTLSPVPLNDLPTSLDELQVYGASYFRGTSAEQVDFLAIDVGDYYVQVTGYLGASSPAPYSLRAATTPTVELDCGAVPAVFPAGTPGTNGTAGSADTLVLMNRSRFEALYGPEETADVLVAIDEMIGAAAANGITATVLDVDALPGVQAAYDGWDASPCSPVAVNNVVSAIGSQLVAIRAGQPIENLLIVGGDDVVPFARVQDATTIANEQSYTNTFTAAEDNALRAAFSGSWILTDDPYGDSAPTSIANTDRVVYIPEVAMGRLVETPGEIVTALDHYVAFNGQLDPQTGFVAGYDFLADGAELTGDNLDEAISPASVQRLINSEWNAADLQAGLATNPDTALVAAHFDHANALPAASNSAGVATDLFDVFDAEAMDFSGSIMFSVGCHGGLSVSDLLIAPTGVVSKDWAQTFLGNGAAAFVGNTGYGYGDDTAVALSEKLMADFAEGLGEYETIGDALLYAKQSYAADLTVYGAFDEKALMEATLYGIPFYTLGNSVVPEPVPNPPTEPAPTGGESYSEAFDPVIEVSGDGTEDEVWSTPSEDGERQIQVTNGYPILPRYEFEVTQQDPANPRQLELEARGVVLESLVTRDEINVDPATARAVYDLAANEPNVDSTDVTFALAPSVTTYLSPEGIRQDVNMTVGAFQSSEADGSGTMRLFEEFEVTVYYADNPAAESTKPVISNVQANPSGGTFDLAVTVQDASPIVRVIALMAPTPRPNELTTWSLLELDNTNGGTWTGDLALEGDSAQWLVMAVDSHGNTGWSMSKQLAFDGDTGAGFTPILLNPTSPAAPVLVDSEVDLSAQLWDFDGSGDAISVTWDFGDGTTCTSGSGGSCELDAPTDADPFGATSATHSYDEPGRYVVTVTATDSAGRTDMLTLAPVVVASETTQGSVIANGRTRPELADGDVVPDGVDGRSRLKVNVTAGYGAEVVDDFNLRFTVEGVFDFRGNVFDYVDVIGDTALVVGSGVLNPEQPNPVDLVYTVFVDDATNTVILRLWSAEADPQTTTPLYQVTATLPKRTAVKVSS